jgi:hypothetical protein
MKTMRTKQEAFYHPRSLELKSGDFLWREKPPVNAADKKRAKE